MLVLTRRKGERIAIGDHILLTVVGIQGNKVRLGISAPDAVTILREEARCKLPKPTPSTEPVLT